MRALRRHRDRRPDQPDRAVVRAALVRDGAEQVQRVGMARRLAHNLAIERLRLGEAAGAMLLERGAEALFAGSHRARIRSPPRPVNRSIANAVAAAAAPSPNS